MVTLMRSTDEKIETNCKLVRDARDVRAKKIVLNFEELFEKWKGGESNRTNQAEHDERLLKYWSSLRRPQMQLHSQEWHKLS